MAEGWQQVLIGLLGVVVGGFIPYFTQKLTDKRTKEENDSRKKHIAYNKILFLDGEKSPLEVPIHGEEKKGFNSEIYRGEIRGVLFDNLHFFDSKITINVLKLDYFEKLYEHDDSQENTDRIFDFYDEIVKLIKKDYKKDLELNSDI